MISCTEFIPAYSELFKYIEEHYGAEAVRTYWVHHFTPDGKMHPLTGFLTREGIRGCYSYWSGTLNEEAADFTMYLNEKAGWYYEVMHRCPSKGRLLSLKDELGVEPYRDYCLHCDHYRAAVEKAGLNYTFDFSGVDHAACSLLITDPKLFDGRMIVDADTIVMDRRAGDNEYFHKDFHYSLNKGVHYMGETFGKDVLVDYLTRYAKTVCRPVLEAVEKEGLSALEAHILDTYKKEKAEDAVSTDLSGDTLTVTVHYCPAVKHMKETGREVSKWYPYTTEVVMSVLAEAAGCRFTMESYDEETGAAKYSFAK